MSSIKLKLSHTICIPGQVLDENDNSPTFVQSQPNVTVPEDAKVKFSFYQQIIINVSSWETELPLCEQPTWTAVSSY